MHKLFLPRLGQTMEQGTVVSWLKKEGDSYDTGEVLYELDTEKVVNDIEAKLPGTIARILIAEGEAHPVGTILAIVADPGETLSAADIEAAAAQDAAAPAAAVAPAAAAAPAVAAAPAAAARVKIMPRARRLAEEMGVDITGITGTGAGGTITVEDVEKAAASAPAGPRVKERRTLKGVGAGMAASVTRSWQIPQFTQIVLVDATGLAARRKAMGPEIKEKYGIDLSYTDLILDAVVKAAVEVPEANATFDNNAVVLYEDVNVSTAVANEEGLVVVPVIHRAQELSVGELGQKIRDIAERARIGALTMPDIEGGTITMSNLGMYGVETGTPILTPPQSSLVFIGAMKPRPLVIDGAIEARSSFYMSIVYDHRVLAGVTAAAFTMAVKRNMEAQE